MVASWNWTGEEKKALEITVYSSFEEVDLYLNGKSLGRKPTNRSSAYFATWTVPYEPGVLKALGYIEGKRGSEADLATAGLPTHIKLTPDRSRIIANGQDLSYINVELLDERGRFNPTAENQIDFSVSGEGSIVAVANANPVSIESYQQPRRKTWQGRCLLIVKSNRRAGPIRIVASSKGLRAATVVLAATRN